MTADNPRGSAFRYTPPAGSRKVISCLLQDGRWTVWHGDTAQGTVQPVHFDTADYGTSDDERRRLCHDVGEQFGCTAEVS